MSETLVTELGGEMKFVNENYFKTLFEDNVWEKWVFKKYFQCIYLTKLEYSHSLKSLQNFPMIRDDVTLCHCTCSN